TIRNPKGRSLPTDLRLPHEVYPGPLGSIPALNFRSGLSWPLGSIPALNFCQVYSGPLGSIPALNFCSGLSWPPRVHPGFPALNFRSGLSWPLGSIPALNFCSGLSWPPRVHLGFKFLFRSIMAPRVHPGFKFLFRSILAPRVHPGFKFLFRSIPVLNFCSGLSWLLQNPRSRPGLLFITRQSKANVRSQSHERQGKSWVHWKSRREQSEELTGKEPRKQRSWHCGTIHHRITEAPKGAQYGTLKIPLSAKVTNDTSGRISGAYRLSWDASDLSRTPFLTGLREARPIDNGSQRLSVNLRGTFTENRDRNDSRTPRDIQRALRKPRSQILRPSRANGLRPEATSQRSPTGQKGYGNECQDAQRAIGDRGHSTPLRTSKQGKTDSRGAESPEHSFTRRMAILGSFKSSSFKHSKSIN
ncbi:hypothetical protein CRG98_030552, partial [Punica granatum]